MLNIIVHKTESFKLTNFCCVCISYLNDSNLTWWNGDAAKKFKNSSLSDCLKSSDISCDFISKFMQRYNFRINRFMVYWTETRARAYCRRQRRLKEKYQYSTQLLSWNWTPQVGLTYNCTGRNLKLPQVLYILSFRHSLDISSIKKFRTLLTVWGLIPLQQYIHTLSSPTEEKQRKLFKIKKLYKKDLFKAYRNIYVCTKKLSCSK